MVALRSFSEEGIDLVDEDDGRLRFPSKAKQACDEFIAFPVPFVRENAGGDIDEGGSGFLCEGFG